jgi:hypothetical protein
VTNRAGRGCAFAALVVATTLATSACDKAAAKTPGPAPEPLTVPMPPSRLVIPVSIEDPAENAAAAAGDRAGGSAGRGSKPPTSGSGAAGSATASGAGSVPPPVPPNPPTSDAGGPPQVLRTAAAGELETRAKERLDRAVRDLGRVSRGSLGADARDQYDSADRFIRMAKDALASRNFVFALSCADKAATLAALLVK